jgi:AcrR family transcriptional regulator
MPADSALDSRDHILGIVCELLRTEGQSAVTTRSVSRIAGIQPPTIYRLFGDMRALLDTAARKAFADFLTARGPRSTGADPIDDLRSGWDLVVAFGASNPAAFTLMCEGRQTPLAQANSDLVTMLRSLVERAAEAGRLTIAVAPAVSMIHASCTGVTLMLINAAPDAHLSTQVREAILAAITVPGPSRRKHSPAEPAIAHAVALDAALPSLRSDLTSAEQALLSEWLRRISAPGRELALF